MPFVGGNIKSVIIIAAGTNKAIESPVERSHSITIKKNTGTTKQQTRKDTIYAGASSQGYL